MFRSAVIAYYAAKKAIISLYDKVIIFHVGVGFV
jgi:hypothetical protein